MIPYLVAFYFYFRFQAAYKLIARQDLASQYEPAETAAKSSSKGTRSLGTLSNGGQTSARVSQSSDLEDDMERLNMEVNSF